MPTLQFKNRCDAGTRLALKIPYCDVVIAIPRGGIPVAEPICIQHQVPLLLTYPRKLGAPKNPEFAFGAVSEYGDVILNQQVIESLGITEKYIHQTIEGELQEIKKRKQRYPCKALSIEDKVIVIVDDGIATGLTMLSAIAAIKSQNPKELIVAVPVASNHAAETIGQQASWVCLHQTDQFGAIGEFYQDFKQVETPEAVAILNKVNQSRQQK